MKDVGALVARVVTGGLLAGHGAQKLFGSFGGHGLEGMTGFMEGLGLRPGKTWAAAGGAAEFGGGILTALGLVSPLGPIGVMSAMTVAGIKIHGGKPIWVTEGGAEYPLTNFAIALALALDGPGKFSLDEALDIEVPAWLSGLFAGGAAATILYILMSAPPVPQQSAANADQPA